jgi:acyl-CoA thioesterase
VPEEITGEDLEKLRSTLGNVPFAKLLGIELAAATHGSVTLRLEIRHDLRQIHGVMHGGAIASLLDTATAFAIVSQLPNPEKFTTVDLTINYLRPLKEGTATARARVIRAGRRLLTVSAEIVDDDGNLAAMAVSTYIKLH